MTTFAERQHANWTTIAQSHAAIEMSDQRLGAPESYAAKAYAVVGAIEAYQPYDFQPGSNWEFVLDNWMHAEKSTCRSMAIAAVAEIQHAKAEYHTPVECAA